MLLSAQRASEESRLASAAALGFAAGAATAAVAAWWLHRRKNGAPSPATRLYDVDPARPVMDTAEFLVAGKAVVEYIAQYRTDIVRSASNVRSTVAPGFLTDAAAMATMPEHGAEWDEIFAEFERLIVPGLTHWESPRFFAYFKPHASYPSVLGEMLSAGLNVMGFSWTASPSCTELESVTLDWLAQLIQLPAEFHCRGDGKGGGVIQGSAGESCIVAMLAARARTLATWRARATGTEASVSLPTLVAYSSDQGHSIVDKAALVLGDGVVLRKLATLAEDGFALQASVLRDAIRADRAAGRLPFSVFATVATTSTCACDPLREIAAVCAADGVAEGANVSSAPWLHLDAAYGGAYAVCPEFRGTVFDGMELVDSLVLNCHKKLLVSFDCAAMWVRDRSALLAALSLDATKNEYLRNAASDSGKVIDYKDWQLPLGRRFRALKLYFVLKSFGADGLRAHIRNGVALAERFEHYVVASPLFELVAKPAARFALVCFRLVKGGDAANEELRDRLNEEGEIHLIHTRIDLGVRDGGDGGVQTVLRLAIGGIEQSEQDIDHAWACIHRAATII